MMTAYIDKWDTIYRLKKMAVDCELFGSKKKAKAVREIIQFLDEDVIEYVSEIPLERREKNVQK